MQWFGRQESSNVEDKRGFGGGGMLMGGGIGTVVLIIISLLFGQNPLQLLNMVNQQPADQTAPAKTNDPSQPEDKDVQFVSVVLKDTEDVWTSLFTDMNKQYEDPKLVLFTDQTQSGCGSASSSTGPFYCPLDKKVYIDLSFYKELKDRFHASGDFANAYVIAHEVGHHVQNLLGITQKFEDATSNLSKEEANKLSVSLELQADFLAGVWANHDESMKHVLEKGDLESALNAASAIGDDRLQMQSQGYVVPDAFTHGTSKQRAYWFKKGYDTGDINQGTTFNNSIAP